MRNEIKIIGMVLVVTACLLIGERPGTVARGYGGSEDHAARVRRWPATTTPAGQQGVLDDLYAKAAVLDDGTTQVALVVCDLISLPRETVLETRKQIEEADEDPRQPRDDFRDAHAHRAVAGAGVEPRRSDGGASDTVELYGRPSEAHRPSRRRGPGKAHPCTHRLRPAIGGPVGLLPPLLDEGRQRRLEPGQAQPEHHPPGRPDRSGGGHRLCRHARGQAALDLRKLRDARDTTGGESISADFPGAWPSDWPMRKGRRCSRSSPTAPAATSII